MLEAGWRLFSGHNRPNVFDRKRKVLQECPSHCWVSSIWKLVRTRKRQKVFNYLFKYCLIFVFSFFMKRCVEYIVDASQPKLYQYFDLPFYNDSDDFLNRKGLRKCMEASNENEIKRNRVWVRIFICCCDLSTCLPVSCYLWFNSEIKVFIHIKNFKSTLLHLSFWRRIMTTVKFYGLIKNLPIESFL